MTHIAILSTIIGLACFQYLYVRGYLKFLQAPTPTTDKDFQPPVTLVICLRGVDPSLKACLESAFELDYPNYRIVFVFDSQEDPAYSFASEFIAADPDRQSKSSLLVFEPQQVGSLKCQAIIEAIRNLDDETEIVALMDADCIAQRNWLQQLVAPLKSGEVGATTGNRHFTPVPATAGGRLRQTWNSAAVVQMVHYNIAWGGSLAIKRSVFEQTDILEKWQSAFCEDTMLDKVLQKNGLKVQRVPHLIVHNTESTTLGSAYRWIVRQLLTSRLYVRWWPLVFLHAIMVGSVLVASLVYMVVASLSGAWDLAALVAVVFACHQAINLILLKRITEANVAIVAANLDNPQDESADLLGRFDYAGNIGAVLLSQIVQPIAAIHAFVQQQVHWRRVRYRLAGSGRVEVIDYRPYSQSTEEAHSIE